MHKNAAVKETRKKKKLNCVSWTFFYYCTM